MSPAVLTLLICAGAALLEGAVARLVNAGWGFLFFRRKDLRASFLAFLPYGGLALLLTGVLAKVDSTSALLMIPYLAYLGYSTWWAYRLWELNTAPPRAANNDS